MLKLKCKRKYSKTMIFNIKEEHKPQSSVALDALYYPHSTETEYNPKFYHISSQKYTYFIFFMIRHISMKLEPICERNAATIKSQKYQIIKNLELSSRSQ
jgi:hypothetical protein